jgi:hypothetical protein
MMRTRVKGNGSKAASSPTTEPNFYEMEPCLAGEAISVDASCVVEGEESGPFMQEDDTEEELVRVQTPEHMIFDRNAAFEEDSGTPVSKETSVWDDNDENDLGVIDLEKSPSTTEAAFTCLPPVVTPGEISIRRILTCGMVRCPPMLPLVSSTDQIPRREQKDEIHTGDQIFFEGLPFHYLEMKDIENSLMCGQVCSET